MAKESIPARLRCDASPADENRVVMAGIPAVSLSPPGGNAHAGQEWVQARGLRRLCRALTALTAQPPPHPETSQKP